MEGLLLTIVCCSFKTLEDITWTWSATSLCVYHVSMCASAHPMDKMIQHLMGNRHRQLLVKRGCRCNIFTWVQRETGGGCRIETSEVPMLKVGKTRNNWSEGNIDLNLGGCSFGLMWNDENMPWGFNILWEDHLLPRIKESDLEICAYRILNCPSHFSFWAKALQY